MRSNCLKSLSFEGLCPCIPPGGLTATPNPQLVNPSKYVLRKSSSTGGICCCNPCESFQYVQNNLNTLKPRRLQLPWTYNLVYGGSTKYSLKTTFFVQLQIFLRKTPAPFPTHPHSQPHSQYNKSMKTTFNNK